MNLRADIGEVFKIRVGLAELPDTAQYWTLDSVRPCVVSQTVLFLDAILPKMDGYPLNNYVEYFVVMLS